MPKISFSSRAIILCAAVSLSIVPLRSFSRLRLRFRLSLHRFATLCARTLALASLRAPYFVFCRRFFAYVLRLFLLICAPLRFALSKRSALLSPIPPNVGLSQLLSLRPFVRFALCGLSVYQTWRSCARLRLRFAAAGCFFFPHKNFDQGRLCFVNTYLLSQISTKSIPNDVVLYPKFSGSYSASIDCDFLLVSFEFTKSIS